MTTTFPLHRRLDCSSVPSSVGSHGARRQFSSAAGLANDGARDIDGFADGLPAMAAAPYSKRRVSKSRSPRGSVDDSFHLGSNTKWIARHTRRYRRSTAPPRLVSPHLPYSTYRAPRHHPGTPPRTRGRCPASYTDDELAELPRERSEVARPQSSEFHPLSARHRQRIFEWRLHGRCGDPRKGNRHHLGSLAQSWLPSPCRSSSTSGDHLICLGHYDRRTAVRHDHADGSPCMKLDSSSSRP